MDATTASPPQYYESKSDLPLQEEEKTDSSSSSSNLTTLDRDSAIALGTLLFLMLVAILWISHTHIKQRRAPRLASIDPEQQPTDARTGIFQKLIFGSDRKDSRRASSYWTGRESGRDSIYALPLYSPSRRVSGMRGQSWSMSPGERERRWWGSVAAHGSTTRADEELPPLPPSPTLSSLSFGDSRTRSLSAFRSCCSCGERVSALSFDTNEMPLPQRCHVPTQDEIEIAGNFKGIDWALERQDKGPDKSILPRVRRDTVTLDPTTPA